MPRICRSMIDRDVRNEADGAVAVPSGGDRADFVFLTRDQLGKRYPGVSLAGLPERGGAGLVIAADLAATEKALGATGVTAAAASSCRRLPATAPCSPSSRRNWQRRWRGTGEGHTDPEGQV